MFSLWAIIYSDVDPQKKNNMVTKKPPNRYIRKFIFQALFFETNSSPPKMRVGRQAFHLGFRSIFRGELLVSGSVVFRSVISYNICKVGPYQL